MRVKMRSTMESRARVAGTNEPIWAITTISALALPQVSRFSSHVGSSDEEDRLARALVLAEEKIVGNEAVVGTGELGLLDHGVAAFQDFQQLSARFELRTAVVAPRRQVREREQQVDLRQRQRGLTNAARLGGDALAQFAKKTALHGGDLLLRVQDLGLMLLQLRRGEALGSHQRLLAFVVGGRVLQVGLADLDVEAEDVVELHLERVDAGALALALFDARNVVLAVAADVAQLVELGGETIANDSAIGERDGRLGDDGALDALPYVAALVERIVKGGKARGRHGVPGEPVVGSLGRKGVPGEPVVGSLGRKLLQAAAHTGQAGQGCRQREHVARVGRLQRNAAQQTLDVENAVQRAAQLLACDERGERGRNRIQALFNLGGVDGWAQHPGAQQALAHRRQRVVERAEQGNFARARKQRLDELQVAHGDRVEDEAVLALVVADAVHMVERSAGDSDHWCPRSRAGCFPGADLGAEITRLGLLRIVQNGPGGTGGGRAARQFESLQRKHAEMVFQQWNRVVGGKDPVIERGLAPRSAPSSQPQACWGPLSPPAA